MCSSPTWFRTDGLELESDVFQPDLVPLDCDDDALSEYAGASEDPAEE